MPATLAIVPSKSFFISSRTVYSCRPTLEILCSSAKAFVESEVKTAVATDVSINVRRFMWRLYTKRSCGNATNNCASREKRKSLPRTSGGFFLGVTGPKEAPSAASSLLGGKLELEPQAKLHDSRQV